MENPLEAVHNTICCTNSLVLTVRWCERQGAVRITADWCESQLSLWPDEVSHDEVSVASATDVRSELLRLWTTHRALLELDARRRS